MGTVRIRRSTRIEHALLRLVLVVMGLGAAFVGYSVLTAPIWVPVAIAIWLSAVVMLAIGLFARLPHDV